MVLFQTLILLKKTKKKKRQQTRYCCMAVSKIVTRVCSLSNIFAKHGGKHGLFFSLIISEKRKKN